MFEWHPCPLFFFFLPLSIWNAEVMSISIWDAIKQYPLAELKAHTTFRGLNPIAAESVLLHFDAGFWLQNLSAKHCSLVHPLLKFSWGFAEKCGYSDYKYFQCDRPSFVVIELSRIGNTFTRYWWKGTYLNLLMKKWLYIWQKDIKRVSLPQSKYLWI